MAATDLQKLWYKGDLMLARYTGETKGGYCDPLNAVKVSILAAGDPHRITSNMTADFGMTKALSHMPKPVEIEIELTEGTRSLLAAALLGTDSAYSQAEAGSQSETITLIEGEWVKLAKRNVENVAIATKTINVDFAVLPKLGMIKALTAGGAGSKTVTYDAGAVAGDKIIGGTNNIIDFAVEMYVENNHNGNPGILTIPKVSVTPATALMLVGAKDYQTLPFKGEIISLTGQDLFTFIPNLTFSAYTP